MDKNKNSNNEIKQVKIQLFSQSLNSSLNANSTIVPVIKRLIEATKKFGNE